MDDVCAASLRDAGPHNRRLQVSISDLVRVLGRADDLDLLRAQIRQHISHRFRSQCQLVERHVGNHHDKPSLPHLFKEPGALGPEFIVEASAEHGSIRIDTEGFLHSRYYGSVLALPFILIALISPVACGCGHPEHGSEDHEAVGRAHQRIGGAFGMRHHAHDVAFAVEDAGDVAQRAVGMIDVAMGDAESVVPAVRRNSWQVNFSPRLRIRAPGNSPASTRIWKPLQMPNTRPPSAAKCLTALMTGENLAMAPQRR